MLSKHSREGVGGHRYSRAGRILMMLIAVGWTDWQDTELITASEK